MTGRQADRPSGRQEDVPLTGQQAGRPAGHQEDAPAGQQAGRPSGDQEEAPTGQQAGRPADHQEDAPAGQQVGRPSGSQDEVPSGHQALRPAGRQDEAPAGQRINESGLDVYLVPIGRDSFECYYEAADEEEPEDPGAGFFGRLRQRFNDQLQEAERARHQAVIEEPKTFLGRMQKRSMRWIAERIAEQRLLWHLRKAKAATLHISADLPNDQADSIMRSSMKRDADRHRNLLIPHTLALIAAGFVAFVPGPNVLGYLFTFTVVGHFLAWRGAVHALHRVAWTIAPNPALTDLRGAFSLEGEARHRLILEVSDRLHMPRMARFVERMATPTS